MFPMIVSHPLTVVVALATAIMVGMLPVEYGDLDTGPCSSNGVYNKCRTSCDVLVVLAQFSVTNILVIIFDKCHNKFLCCADIFPSSLRT